MDYLSTTWTGVYYAVYPIFYILFLILDVLSIITAPLLHLGHYILSGCLYPIHILAKFEVGFQTKYLVRRLSGRCRLFTSFLVSPS